MGGGQNYSNCSDVMMSLQLRWGGGGSRQLDVTSSSKSFKTALAGPNWKCCGFFLQGSRFTAEVCRTLRAINKMYYRL